MTSENLKLWSILGRTDPKHTKSFTRGGGFKGTAIKPMWSYRRMTEEFGPCGFGWGVGAPEFQVVPAGDEVLVFCTASVWYCHGDDLARTVYGVGGDKVVNKFSTGLKTDDEAFKKAFTDAVTNALKMIGVGADVHMGMFDDSKYVNTMKAEFAEPGSNVGTGERQATPIPPRDFAPPPPDETYAPPPRKANGLPETGWREDGSRTSFWLKKNGTFEELRAELYEDALDCHTPKQLEDLKADYRKKARDAKLNKRFMDGLAEEFGSIERRILESMDAAELAEVPLKDALEKSLSQHPIMAG